jgi:4-amino-4-deoxy-L-arabinose transferase-like glycosyltransferase
MIFVNNPRRALAVLIVFTFVLRLGWAALIEAGTDEAYNYLYTVYPSWSYFDHPPMTMWIAKSSLTLFGGHAHLLSLRLGYLLLFAGSTWVLYRMTSRWYGDWAGFYAALALNLSAYYSVALGAFAVPDGPFLFFALLTLWSLSEALVGRPGSTRVWVCVGLAWCGALLSKYHAIFLPAGALLYVLMTPSARRLMLTPGPYLAVAIGIVGFAPVLIWNAEHGWASFVFQGGRALGWHLRLAGPATLILGTIVVLLPWIWFAMLRAVVELWRRPAWSDIDRLLLCLSILPLGFFLVISIGRELLVHWALLGFVPLFCLVGQRWAALAEVQPLRLRRRLLEMAAALAGLALVVVAQARFGVVDFQGKDPCREFSGWQSVAQELKHRGLVDQPNTFLFTNCWDDSGHLALAVGNRVPVLCYHRGDARGFAFWTRPEEWVGMNGLLISTDDNPTDPGQFERYFDRIELAAEFSMTRGGKPFRKVRVFRCTNQVTPYPFTYDGAGRSTKSTS